MTACQRAGPASRSREDRQMEQSGSEKKQKAECYNCFRLIPSDSKFCPYCGNNQLEKSGYTLRGSAPEGTPQETRQEGPQPVRPAIPPYSPMPSQQPQYTGFPPYGYMPPRQRKPGVDWVDIAKYGGILGTLLYIIVLLMEFGYVIYGFGYLPKMSAFYINPAFPFYFITPLIVGIPAINGPGFAAVYVLWVMIAVAAFAYVVKTSRNFSSELKLKSGGVKPSTIYMLGTMVMAYYFISIVVVLVVEGLGSQPSAPNFTGIPWYMTVWQLVFASVWEEVAARVLLIGAPLLIVAAFRRNRDRVWWKYLIGGNFEMKPEVVFFLIVSSVMFGLGHWLAGSGWGIWKVLPAAIGGLFMGYLFLKKGLFASVIFHFSVDTEALLVLAPNGNFALSGFLGIVTVIWSIIGAVFFTYYVLLAFGYLTNRNLLPKRVISRYAGGSAAGQQAITLAAAAPTPQPSPPPPQQELHPYRPPRGNGPPIMRDPHSPVPAAPGDPVFGYMCSNCGSLEAKYKDGKFVCVYCGHESDK